MLLAILSREEDTLLKVLKIVHLFFLKIPLLVPLLLIKAPGIWMNLH